MGDCFPRFTPLDLLCSAQTGSPPVGYGSSPRTDGLGCKEATYNAFITPGENGSTLIGPEPPPFSSDPDRLPHARLGPGPVPLPHGNDLTGARTQHSSPSQEGLCSI
jgi:hypothetical protein